MSRLRQQPKPVSDAVLDKSFERYLRECAEVMAEALKPPRVDEFARRRAKYVIFHEEADQRAMKWAVKRMLEDAHVAGIKNVVAAGFSAKPAADFLVYAWEEAYGKEGAPKLFSLGDSVLDAQRQYISKPDEVGAFKGRFAGLFDDFGKIRVPTLVMEEYLLRGTRLWNVEQILFRSMGYDDPRHMTAADKKKATENLWLGSFVFNWEGRNPGRFANQDHLIWGTGVSVHNDGPMYPRMPWMRLRSILYSRLTGKLEPNMPYGVSPDITNEQIQQELKRTDVELKLLAKEVGAEMRKK